MRKRFVLWLLLLVCSPFWALADEADGLPVKDLAVLTDATGRETITSVSAPAAADRFVPLDGRLNAGYSRAVHWLRFTVQAPAAGEWWLEVQPPFLDDLRLFEPVTTAGGTVFREQRGGDTRPFAERPIAYRSFVAPLKIPDTQPRTFYLRLQTSSSSLAFVTLWTPRAFQQTQAQEYAVLGLYFGLMATLLVTNLIYWCWLREALYGYFCLHVAALALLYFGANGFAAQWLFQDNPAAANLWVSFFVFASVSAGAPFYRRILRIERDRPALWLVYRTQLVVPLLLTVTLVSGHYIEAIRLMMALTLGVALVSLCLAYRLWRRGGREGLFLMLGVAITVLGAVPLILMLLGVLPGAPWVLHLRQSAVLGSILAMHVAVAARMRQMAAERRAALERAHAAETRVAEERQMQEEHRQFLAMLTHELRTPLSVIDGAVQSLEYIQQPGDEATGVRYRRIRRSVRRINGLVRQFLAKDKVDDARLTIRPVWLDAVEQARLAMESSVEDAGERLRLNAPEALAFRGDAALVQVALLNLIDNALKYSPPDSDVVLEIEPQARADTAGVAWTVADRGPGIDRQDGEAVFDKFVRGQGHGHMAGAGLGLYLVRRIAELHGGGVEILERPDWGAVLRLWLPCTLPATQPGAFGPALVAEGALP